MTRYTKHSETVGTTTPTEGERLVTAEGDHLGGHLRTDNTIRYNAKRRHWRRTKIGF